MYKKVVSILIFAIILLNTYSIKAFGISNGNNIIESISRTGTIGDADLNGVITVRDATAIQKYLAEIIAWPKFAKVFSDSDGDGKVTIKDSTVVQKYVAGIDVRQELTLKYLMNSTNLVPIMPNIIGDELNTSTSEIN